MKSKPVSPKASARKLKGLEKARKAAEYRKNALSLRAIAELMGCSHTEVRRLVQKGLEELREDLIVEVDDYRAAQIRRREEMIEVHRPIALDPDHEKCTASAAIVDKNETALSKLLGTDQPIQVENKTEVSGGIDSPFTLQVVGAEVKPPFTPPMPDDVESEEEENIYGDNTDKYIGNSNG